MKLNGIQFLNVLNDYFSKPDIIQNGFWLLLIPALLFLIWLYIYYNPRQSNKNPFDDIPENELDVLKQISAQKGLSSFDRDFLIMQALLYKVKPSNMLLDITTFESVATKIEDKIKKEDSYSDSDENLKNLRRLRKKLFY